MAEIHPAALPIDELRKECEIKRTRRGGPGGQHRNKTDSAIVVTHLPSGVTGQAGERRSQHANQAVAIERLRVNLALDVRIFRDPHEGPSSRWQDRVRRGKLSISPNHDDFATLLAEALDKIAAARFDVSAAATSLQVTTSQLVKFLKLHPPAFLWLNQNRQDQGLSLLK
jgi:hypothetical protein